MRRLGRQREADKGRVASARRRCWLGPEPQLATKMRPRFVVRRLGPLTLRYRNAMDRGPPEGEMVALVSISIADDEEMSRNSMRKETRWQPQVIGDLVEDYYKVVHRSLVAASAMHRDVAAAILKLHHKLRGPCLRQKRGCQRGASSHVLSMVAPLHRVACG